MKRIVCAFYNSFNGLKDVWRDEMAFRQEVVLAVILIPLAFFLDVTSTERALLIGAVILVMIVEVLNSSIEAIVDLASPEKHELARKAKDTGSLAVMGAFILLGVIWIGVLAS